MLKKADAKTRGGLDRIRLYLSSHFDLNDKSWAKIQAHILDGTLDDAGGSDIVILNIKTHIPKASLKHTNKAHIPKSLLQIKKEHPAKSSPSSQVNTPPVQTEILPRDSINSQ